MNNSESDQFIKCNSNGFDWKQYFNQDEIQKAIEVIQNDGNLDEIDLIDR